MMVMMMMMMTTMSVWMVLMIDDAVYELPLPPSWIIRAQAITLSRS